MPTPVPRLPAEAQFVKALIHSPAGHGKTHFLGTAQEDERTYPMALLNFEGGDQSLVGLDIDIYDIRDWKDYDDVYAMLRNPKAHQYRSVGVDSITETQITGLLNILEFDKKRADPDQLAQQDWGVILVRMRRVIRHYVKMLPMHVFMTALSKDDVVSRVGQVKTPAVQGAFANELPGILDVVGYLALEETDGMVKRILLLHDYPKFSVKVRTPWNVEVPAEIEDPTVTRLLDALGYV
jgi:hypothetical protein